MSEPTARPKTYIEFLMKMEIEMREERKKTKRGDVYLIPHPHLFLEAFFLIDGKLRSFVHSLLRDIYVSKCTYTAYTM